MLRIVVDTNIRVRALLGGPISLPVLQALYENKFLLLISDALIDELRDVTQRPRLKRGIEAEDIQDLLEQLELRGEYVTLTTIPPILPGSERSTGPGDSDRWSCRCNRNRR